VSIAAPQRADCVDFLFPLNGVHDSDPQWYFMVFGSSWFKRQRTDSIARMSVREHCSTMFPHRPDQVPGTMVVPGT